MVFRKKKPVVQQETTEIKETVSEGGEQPEAYRPTLEELPVYLYNCVVHLQRQTEILAEMLEEVKKGG